MSLYLLDPFRLYAFEGGVVDDGEADKSNVQLRIAQGSQMGEVILYRNGSMKTVTSVRVLSDTYQYFSRHVVRTFTETTDYSII